MRVNDTSLNSTAASQSTKAQEVQNSTSQAARKAAAGQSAQTDQVEISSFSTKVMQAASADSPERTAKVEKLAAEYKAGRYQPDSAATSRGIVNDAMLK